MGKLRWYKRDPDAALGGMMGLTLEERGAYNTVLDLIYARDDQLPDDDHFVAGWCQVDVRVWKRIKANLIAKKKLTTCDGLLRNFRATSVILAGLEIISQREEAGRQGGRKSGAIRRQNNELTEATAPPSAAPNIKAKSNTTTTTTTTTSITPPKGGVGTAPPPFLWEADLFAIEGVKGSGLEISPYPAMVQLQLDGFDLHAEVIPAVKRDILRAQQQGRTNRLSWHTIAQRVREGRSQADAVRSTPAASNNSPDTGYVAPWEDRMFAARQRKQWPRAKWGPMPNEPGCLAPSELVLPSDGQGWTEWKFGESSA